MSKAIELAKSISRIDTFTEFQRMEVLEAANELRRLAAVEQELAEAKDLLQFVERWANHHGAKPCITAESALSCIQHHPGIVAITKGYVDGVLPATPNPWQELEALKAAMGEPVATVEGGRGRFLMWARDVLPHSFDVGTRLYTKVKPCKSE